MLLIIVYVLYVPVEVDTIRSCSSFWGQGYDSCSTAMGDVHINTAKAS